MFTVTAHLTTGEDVESFNSLDELRQNLHNTATDEYTASVMTWAKSATVGDSMEIANGRDIEKWERVS